MSEKDLNMTLYLDFYGELLPDTQRSVLSLFYNEDYTQSEIAEQIGISRQGVRDALKRGEETLSELEEKLGLAGRYRMQKQALDRARASVRSLRDACGESDPEAIRKLISDVSEAFDSIPI